MTSAKSKKRSITVNINSNTINKSGKTKWESFIRYMKLYKWLYVFLIPGMTLLFIFRYIPMYGVVIAFKDFNLTKGIWGSEWVGLEHFKYLFSYEKFYLIFRNSLWISILRLVWGFPAPVFLALMLNEMRKVSYKRTMQTVLYLPHFISWVVVAGMVINFLSPSTGILNHIIELFGGEPVAFLQSQKYFRSIIIISGIWKEAGWGTIVYLAAMAGISMEAYEAAIIDGANRFQRIWYVTMPGITSTIVVLLILRMGYILNNGFEQIFLLYTPMVYDVGDVFETYTYRVGLLEGRFSFATAVGIFQSLVGIILIFSTNKLSKMYGKGGIW